MKGPISQPQTAIRFWQMAILHHILSEDLNETHNFTILNICDITLYHSIVSIVQSYFWLGYHANHIPVCYESCYMTQKIEKHSFLRG